MKRLIALTLVTLGITVSARAQWIVYDPANPIQSVINTAQEIAKYVEMIQNQVQQIQALEDQLSEFKHYEDLFGDPKSVLLSTVQPLIGDLKKTELGQTLTTLESTISVALVHQGFDCLTAQRLKVHPLTPAPPPFVVGVAYRKETSSRATENFIAAAKCAKSA